MPLDLPSNDSGGPTQSSSPSSSHPLPNPPSSSGPEASRVQQFFEMIRASPEARRGSEQSNQHSFEPLLPDYMSRYTPESRYRMHRRSHGDSSTYTRSYHLPEWRQPDPRAVPEWRRPLRNMPQPSMPAQRSIASLGLLRRELEGDITFISSEISGLERELEDLLGRFPHEEHHPRNHYRHSSMSMSPRILDSGRRSSSSVQQLAEGQPCRKLEDGLLFLEMRRSSKLRIPAHVQDPQLNRPFVRESSWLRSGTLFRGSQSLTADSRRSPYLGQLVEFRSQQLKGWKLDLVIDRVDYSNMTMEGILTAYVEPHSEIERVSSYWTGELIDFDSHYSFISTHWSGSLSDDADHWRRLEPFRDMSDPSFLRALISHKYLADICEKYIFFRIKEHCFTQEPPAGLYTIGGFYYCCLRRDDGHLEGFYFDPVQPLQKLALQPMWGITAQGKSFPIYSFR